jgi:putative oxidoreductase
VLREQADAEAGAVPVSAYGTQGADMFITLVRTDNSPVQLFSRLALGVVMFPQGAQKVFGWYGGGGFAQTIQLYAEMGLPGWVTVPLMALELGGSLLLMVGVLTRLWALGFAISTTACMFMNWSGQQGVGSEYHLLVLGMVIGLLIRGGGLLSIDRAITPDSEVL